MEVIPAIDIQDGKCVRLYQGDFARVTVYDEDPLVAAQRWVAQGARRLHIVDLDGARAGRPVNGHAIEAIVRAVPVPVQLGGGLRNEPAVRSALRMGVERVILGTAAVGDPQLIAQLVAQYGEAILVGVDARDGMVATSGWTETAAVRAAELVDRMAALGVRRVVYTDIARDGTLEEPNYEAIAALVRPGGPAIIAAGGVGRLAHLQRLAAIGVEAAVVGRALYTGDLRLPEALGALRRY